METITTGEDIVLASKRIDAVGAFLLRILHTTFVKLALGDNDVFKTGVTFIERERFSSTRNPLITRKITLLGRQTFLTKGSIYFLQITISPYNVQRHYPNDEKISGINYATPDVLLWS